MNLPDTARDSISEDMVVALSQTLRERPQQVWASISAAIPTILWFYADKASTPDGADELAAAAEKRDAKLLTRLPEAFTGEPGRSLLTESQQQFTSLFQRDATDAISHAISSFSGMSIASARQIVGATHLITLALLSKDARARSGRDLAHLLSEGKPSIAAAIPTGLHEHLESIPRLHQIAHPYDEGVPATAGDDEMEGEAELHRQEPAPGEHYYAAADEMDRVPGSLVWVLPILIALAIGAAMVFTIYPRNANSPIAAKPTQPPVIAVTPNAQPAAAVLPGPQLLRDLKLPADPSLTDEIATQIERFTRTLREANASGTFPEITSRLSEVNHELATISSRFQRLPPDQQQRVAALVSQLLPALQSSADETTNMIANTHVRMQINDVIRTLRQFTLQPA